MRLIASCSTAWITAEMIAINTDVQSLTSSVATHKVQIGRNVTRGLGAGGDPELGYQAAHESADELREVVTGCADGFHLRRTRRRNRLRRGSGRCAVGARDGALVLVFATLPFAFEGKRRAAQAEEALADLQRDCRRGHLFRERSHGRHGFAEGGDSSGFRRRRHHHQPERARDRECRSATRA